MFIICFLLFILIALLLLRSVLGVVPFLLFLSPRLATESSLLLWQQINSNCATKTFCRAVITHVSWHPEHFSVSAVCGSSTVIIQVSGRSTPWTPHSSRVVLLDCFSSLIPYANRVPATDGPKPNGQGLISHDETNLRRTSVTSVSRNLPLQAPIWTDIWTYSATKANSELWRSFRDKLTTCCPNTAT